LVLKLLDAFAGIGGFSYAAERLVGGYETKQFIEIDKYCQSVLKKNFPNIPIHDDIKTFKAERGEYDVLTAGFPCQDLSVAGQQRGIGEGTRSGLFYEVIRLIREIRPKFVLLENVRNLLSHQGGETFQEVLFQIAKAGYDAEWSVVSAKDVGACHKRERVWIIAYPNSEYEDRTEGTFQTGRDSITSSTSSNSNGMLGLDLLRQQSEQEEKEHERFSDRDDRSTSNSTSIKSNDGEVRNNKGKGKEQLQTGGDSSRDVTNSHGNGSFTTERIRVDGQTNTSSQERENEVSKFKGGSKSRGSEVIQRFTDYRWEPQESQLNPYWKGYISQPTLRRGDDGLSNRVLRLKSLGNSIVPACAAVPLQRIKRLSQIVGEGTKGRTYIK
jgi:DNA (cytosine-5)-methyltransferase 1